MKTALTFFLLLLSFSAICQNGILKGHVQTADGRGAPYVNVLLKGTTKGAVTKANGSFEIRGIESGEYTLVVSFVGYEAEEIRVNMNTDVVEIEPVVLAESHEELQEIVISGSRAYKDDVPSASLRLKTPVIETPQNIQIVTRQLLADQQVFDILEGLTRNVSGAQRVEHWDNYARINMRGTQITAFRNGMNVTMPWGPLAEDMSMVERVEFVKGPAGFMVSNGEPGGFYNIVTKKPTGFTKGEVAFSLGSFDTYRTTVDLDGKVSKDGKLLYRLNVMGQLKGSHRDYEFNNRYAIVPVLKYNFDDRTSLTFEFTQQFVQMSAIGSNYAFSGQRYGDLPVNFTTSEPNLDPSKISDQSALATFSHRFNNRWSFTGQLAWFHYKQTGQSLWPWSVTQEGLMQRGVSIWDALGINKTGQFFVNGEEKTGSINHRLLFGLDMSHKDYFADWAQGGPLGAADFNIYDPQYGTVPASEFPVYDRSLSIRERGVLYNTSYTAFYAQDELGFFDNRVRLTLAGRYTTAADANPYSGSVEHKKFTPRFGLSFSIDKNTTLYGVLDQSFLPNPGTDYQGNGFDPVTGTNLEAGFKKELINDSWNIGLTAYQITKNNILALDTEHPDPNTGQLVYSRQIGQTRTRGIEFDLRGEIVTNLSVVLNYALTDARVTRDSDEANVGNRVPGSTKHINNLWLTYRLDDGFARGLGLSLGYQWQIERSSWYVFDGSEQSLPDYFRTDGAISWQGKKLNVALNVNNLLNEYLYSGSPYGDYFYWQTEPRRNWRMTVAYKF